MGKHTNQNVRTVLLASLRENIRKWMRWLAKQDGRSQRNYGLNLPYGSAHLFTILHKPVGTGVLDSP